MPKWIQQRREGTTLKGGRGSAMKNKPPGFFCGLPINPSSIFIWVLSHLPALWPLNLLFNPFLSSLFFSLMANPAFMHIFPHEVNFFSTVQFPYNYPFKSNFSFMSWTKKSVQQQRQNLLRMPLYNIFIYIYIYLISCAAVIMSFLF